MLIFFRGPKLPKILDLVLVEKRVIELHFRLKTTKSTERFIDFPATR